MTAAAPSGVVTFLFTDVEGSTRRWEADADAMRAALAAHDEVLRSGIEAHGGFISSTPGTGYAPPSRRRDQRSMLRWPRSGLWSCRCEWGWRPARPSCARVNTRPAFAAGARRLSSQLNPSQAEGELTAVRRSSG